MLSSRRAWFGTDETTECSSIDNEIVFILVRKANGPVLLRFQAHLAFESGVLFYKGNEKVWLADHVPPGFIEF